MIAAFLCGLMFGWLGYRKWLTAHNRHVLEATLPPSDDEFDMEAWGALSDEALANFEQLASAPHDSGTDTACAPSSGYQPLRYPSSGTQM